jgi:transcription elongation factor
MFGWRKRNEGFEWREYVRRRRRDRRERVGQAAKDAVQNLKAAGTRGATGQLKTAQRSRQAGSSCRTGPWLACKASRSPA